MVHGPCSPPRRILLCALCKSYAYFITLSPPPFCNSQYLFTHYFLVSRSGMGGRWFPSIYFCLRLYLFPPHVYRASSVRGDECKSSCLVLQLQSAKVSRTVTSSFVQGGSNMTGTDLCVNKPHCAAAVRP